MPSFMYDCVYAYSKCNAPEPTPAPTPWPTPEPTPEPKLWPTPEPRPSSEAEPNDTPVDTGGGGEGESTADMQDGLGVRASDADSGGGGTIGIILAVVGVCVCGWQGYRSMKGSTPGPSWRRTAFEPMEYEMHSTRPAAPIGLGRAPEGRSEYRGM
jgi:hypothetical protein